MINWRSFVRMRHRIKRRHLVALVLVACVALAALLSIALASGGDKASSNGSAAADVGAPTAYVERRDLSETLDVDGTLGFGDERTVITRSAGIVTSVAGAGVVVETGDPLYVLDGTPTLLLDGSLPATRDFVEGMTDGEDVAELERNLKALGCDPNNLIVVDRHFTASTRAAIEALQRKRGTAVTGTLPLGTVAFLPGERRVTTVYTSAGSAVSDGARVLDTAATSRVVTMTLATSQRALVAIGGHVDVLLPNGSEVHGTISALGGTANVDPNADPSASSTVTVSVAIKEHLKDPDGTPVTVRLTTEKRRNVLSVPVTTLLASSGGRRSLEVVNPDGSTRLVPVHAGLYAGGYVEISGAGIHDGMRVLDAPTS